MTTKSTRWRRLGGEFLLIVLGVLTALAIDSWVSWAVDRRTEVHYLRGIVADLESDTVLLRQLIGADEALDLDAARLLERLDRDPMVNEALPPVAMTLLQVSGERRLPFASATYEDLVGSGSLNLIREPAVRHEIIAYYRNASELPVALDREADQTAELRLIAADLIPLSVTRDLYMGHAPSIDAEAELLEVVRRSPAARTTLERFLKGTQSRLGLLRAHESKAKALLSTIEP